MMINRVGKRLICVQLGEINSKWYQIIDTLFLEEIIYYMGPLSFKIP
jgi:hypothetical protein